MKYAIIILALVILVAAVIWIKSRPSEIIYKKGESIKNYKLLSEEGTDFFTEGLMGQWIVIYFYPKDDTPGCTKEAQVFSAMLGDFKKAGAVVYGLNTDSPESHRKFRAKYNLTVPLLSDPSGKAMKDFGVRMLAGLCARDSVLINPEGKFEAAFRGVTPASHPAEILKYITDHSR